MISKMEAKLIKENNGYTLFVDDKIFGDTDGHPLKSITNKLSLKNCQSIERGYDLDELIDNITPKNGTTGNISERIGFVKGFQKALELMGDKKFSEEDIRKAMDWIMSQYFGFHEQPTTGAREKFIHSLQQTEWDVEIEMICPHPEDTYVCGLQYGCGFDGDMAIIKFF